MLQLLYFFEDWCKHCVTLTPSIDQLKKTGQIKVEKIQVEYEPDKTKRFKVTSIPTVVLLQDGTELRRFTGTRSYNQIINFLNGE